MDHRGLAWAIHLVAQAAHVDVQKIGRRNEPLNSRPPQEAWLGSTADRSVASYIQAAETRVATDRYAIAALGDALDQIEFQ
jgi:hypothetical protein